ncbi:hypothetical protein [Okeania sp.]|uniref:hypothetical protein n=1 Tax=Okeania sp. TaxID=3100323 RepID=UPI002B4B3548|nr:hypothetical protein [Okeania sp.]MEB3340017.1 hypothetical protein [Okeania sp.]
MALVLIISSQVKSSQIFEAIAFFSQIERSPLLSYKIWLNSRHCHNTKQLPKPQGSSWKHSQSNFYASLYPKMLTFSTKITKKLRF